MTEEPPAVAADAPAFERTSGYQFSVGEDVFVIDTNGYDIWEAQITAVVGASVAVHYPDYPDDDEELTGIARLLRVTDKNREIFDAMEQTREAVAKGLKKSNPRQAKALKKTKTKPKGSRSNPRRVTTKTRKHY
jgi:IS4 transposase